MSDNGFIPVKRSLFNHFLYTEKRVFSRFEAWLDLIQMATFQAEQTRLIKGMSCTTKRGELIASLRYLEERWGWSIGKVRDYLELLRSHNMVVATKEQGINKLTLVNFDKHNLIEENGKKHTKKHSETPNNSGFEPNGSTGKSTQKAQSEHSESTKKNNSNNANNEKNVIAAKAAKQLEELLNREKVFYEALKAYLIPYKPEMLRKFYDYWREPNKSGTKMRWEQERTWDLALRLKRWSDNDFNKNKNLTPTPTPDATKNDDKKIEERMEQQRKEAGFGI